MRRHARTARFGPESSWWTWNYYREPPTPGRPRLSLFRGPREKAAVHVRTRRATRSLVAAVANAAAAFERMGVVVQQTANILRGAR